MQRICRFFIFSLIFSVFVVMASAHVLADGLEFDSIEISRDGDRVLKTSSGSGSFDVDPGDELSLRVTLENTYDDDNDIVDVRVVAWIDGIDDGDEVDDSETVDVNSDSFRVVRLKLRIPEDASSYESYDLEISARGYDQNGSVESVYASFDVDVEREENELVFEDLRMGDVLCGRDGTLHLEIRNVGEDDEEDVELEVISDRLGVIYSDVFDLDSYVYSDEGEFEDDIRLDLDGLSEGSHYLDVRVSYNDGRETLRQEVSFDVEGCGGSYGSGSAGSGSGYYDDYDDYDRYSYGSDRGDVDVRTEPYSNPRRDLSFLYGEQDVEVELYTMPVSEPAPRIPDPEPKDSPFSMFVLTIANIAVLIFLILLLWTLYDRYA